MSSGVDVGKRSGIWSYFGFSSTPRRRVSVSLPTRNTTSHFDLTDPYEKPDRHISGRMHSKDGGRTAWMNAGQRTRLVKALGLVTFIIAIFFFLAPSERHRVGKYVEDHAPFHGQQGDVASDPSVGTSKCTKSSSPQKPIVQYALMIDAGSTGSRIHVYRFNNCNETPELEDEIFEQTEPRKGGSGLSSHAPNADAAAASLDVLMEVAMKNVPDKLKPCTPISVKATAGLRKLGEEMSDQILEEVRTRLESKYPFPVVSKDNGGVEVMPGEDEGVFAWITVNYLLGRIGGPAKHSTAAVFDLGGGSTQIVFEPTFNVSDTLPEGDHKYSLNFGGHEYLLYQHSYLGYGLMAARGNIHQAVISSVHAKNGEDHTWLASPIINPCIAPGMEEIVEVALDFEQPYGEKKNVTMKGPHAGAPAQCRAIAEATLEKEAECKLMPCAFKGVYQPSLEETFATEDIYLFSYFYDRTRVLGMPENFSIRELKEVTERVCHGESEWDVFYAVEDAVKELKKKPEFCLDLNFMVALLHSGYEMPIDREVRIAKKVKGKELGWCLGASLPLLAKESGWQCKVMEIS
ncbi:GDA1/CD39 family protein [Eremomyces bilateralis CBS 781.70]|uniref:guanosine-diphosphatase n=1 Tax=Eremomyces bilateralis CBS 781.70 TaxID=1392243 RepID=A0A6G1GA07_9PEZI|nr:GDA1/CD39 family protein [Eremomyces bilateralis CBS 781.70]KAF1814908.1 GDA1/CD39 family protein [Eremomyces bilateralis CBS 781.70]